MHLLGATDESTERKLVVRALVLDLLDLISIRSIGDISHLLDRVVQKSS